MMFSGNVFMRCVITVFMPHLLKVIFILHMLYHLMNMVCRFKLQINFVKRLISQTILMSPYNSLRWLM